MPHSGWRITSQLTDQVVNSPAGQTLTGVQVYFITGNGNEGSVFIANQHYNKATVAQAVALQATLLDEIGGLSEGAAQVV